MPATEWVANLRNELESIPRPNVPDFEPTFYEDYNASRNYLQGDVFVDDLSTVPQQDYFTADVTNPLDLSPAIPLSTLEEDATFLQNTDVDLDFIEDSLAPPPLPNPPACDLYLPPPELGTALLSEYLVDFNTAYPLYRPHVLAEHLRVCYAGESDGSAVSWVSAYVVFGLGHMLRGMSAAATLQDNDLAKYYLCRTYTSLSSLLLSPPSLGLVQCLIGVAILIRSTPCGPNVPDGHFLSTSLRVAQSLAYHDDDDDDDAVESDRDIEQERRVFWLAFINDTNTSLLSNSPTTHRRDDILAPKPEECPADSLGAVVAAEGGWSVNIFSLRVNLALLQAEAIEQVLSMKARNNTRLDIEAASAMVFARLRAFHEHEIFTLSPEQLFQLLYRSDVAHTVNLEASYFITVYRLNAFLAFRETNNRVNPFSLEGMRQLSRVREQKSYAEAKRLLSLLCIAPRGDVGLYWNQLQALIAAFVTVVAYHIHNPNEDAPSSKDMRVLHELVIDVGKLMEKSDNAELVQVRDFCGSLLLRLESTLHSH